MHMCSNIAYKKNIIDFTLHYTQPTVVDKCAASLCIKNNALQPPLIYPWNLV